MSSGRTQAAVGVAGHRGHSVLRALISQAGVGLVSAAVRVSKGDNDMKLEVPGLPGQLCPTLYAETLS